MGRLLSRSQILTRWRSYETVPCWRKINPLLLSDHSLLATIAFVAVSRPSSFETERTPDRQIQQQKHGGLSESNSIPMHFGLCVAIVDNLRRREYVARLTGILGSFCETVAHKTAVSYTCE